MVTVKSTSETRTLSSLYITLFSPHTGMLGSCKSLFSYYALGFTFACLILDCGGVSKLTSNIVIKSKGYPLQLYDTNYFCSWFYYSDQKFDVSVDLKMSRTSCTTAKVEFHQGTDQNATYNTFCQDTDAILLRNLDRLLIVLKSDDQVKVSMAFNASFDFSRQTPKTTASSTPAVLTKSSSVDSTSVKTAIIDQGFYLVIDFKQIFKTFAILKVKNLLMSH